MSWGIQSPGVCSDAAVSHQVVLQELCKTEFSGDIYDALKAVIRLANLFQVT